MREPARDWENRQVWGQVGAGNTRVLLCSEPSRGLRQTGVCQGCVCVSKALGGRPHGEKGSESSGLAGNSTPPIWPWVRPLGVVEVSS